MKKYDYTNQMSADIIKIDASTFKDITLAPDQLSLRMSANDSYEIFVKYSNNSPVGFIGIMYVNTPHYNGAWIDLIAVCPEEQGKGMAAFMISYVKDYISDNRPDTEFISALARSTNLPSLKAFKKEGFANDGKGNFELLFCNL
ncbi:MAG: GNAT family N-acetyltransferase [Proteocatella sp.]